MLSGSLPCRESSVSINDQTLLYKARRRANYILQKGHKEDRVRERGVKREGQKQRESEGARAGASKQAAAGEPGSWNI